MRGSILSLFLFISLSSTAQRYSVGTAAAYGSKIEASGYQLRAYYNVDHKTCFGPELTIFPKTTHEIGGENLDVSLTEFNFNGHQHLYFGLKHLGFYPLTGVNWSREETGEDVHEAFGINFGAGLHYSKKKWTIFTEAIHLTGDLSQQTFLLGIFYTPSKHHEPHE